MSMKKAKIVEGTETGSFGTTTQNTGAAQRDKLEEIIKNLAPLTGEQNVFKKKSARGVDFYRVGTSAYQSATNTILELSRRLMDKA